MVSTMSSVRRTSAPSTSVTSAARCFNTGSPNTRMEYRGTRSEYWPSGANRIDLDAEASRRAGGGGQRVAQGAVIGGADQPAAVVRAEHLDAPSGECGDKRFRRLPRHQRDRRERR